MNANRNGGCVSLGEALERGTQTLMHQPTQRLRASILVVEDDVPTAELMEAALTQEGYDVALAPSGSDGLAWIDAGAPPDLVILDLMLPDGDGVDL